MLQDDLRVAADEPGGWAPGSESCSFLLMTAGTLQSPGLNRQLP